MTTPTPATYARLARTMRDIGDTDSARLYAEQYHREARRYARIRAARHSLVLTYHRLARYQRASGDEASALIYEAAATEWDEKKHPRAKDGKFASGAGGGGAAGGTSGKKKPEAKKDKETETPETPEWNGEIIQDEVEESRSPGAHITSWDFWDGREGPFKQQVRIEEGEYNPFPDDPDYEPIEVYRWVSSQDGMATDNGEWTDDYDTAWEAGEEFARDNHQEPPEEEEEEEEEEEDYDDDDEEEEDDEDEDDDSSPPSSLPEKAPRQSAAKVINVDANPEKVVKALNRLFPDISDPAEQHAALASSLGAPDDAEIHILEAGIHTDEEGAYGLTIEIHHPAIKDSADRFLGVDRNGKKFIHNLYLELKKEAQGSGLGLEIFSNQVASAAAHGFDQILTHAAGHNGHSKFNGYYTWAVFGYNETVASIRTHSPNLASKIRREFPDAKSVRDVIRADGGEEWWKENGSDLRHAKFDLREGSWSRFLLAKYIEKRAARKKAKEAAEAPKESSNV